MRNKMLFFVFLVSALVVLSGQVRAGCLDEGIGFCQTNPAACGLSTGCGSLQTDLDNCKYDLTEEGKRLTTCNSNLTEEGKRLTTCNSNLTEEGKRLTTCNESLTQCNNSKIGLISQDACNTQISTATFGLIKSTDCPSTTGLITNAQCDANYKDYITNASCNEKVTNATSGYISVVTVNKFRDCTVDPKSHPKPGDPDQRNCQTILENADLDFFSKTVRGITIGHVNKFIKCSKEDSSDPTKCSTLNADDAGNLKTTIADTCSTKPEFCGGVGSSGKVTTVTDVSTFIDCANDLTKNDPTKCSTPLDATNTETLKTKITEICNSNPSFCGIDSSGKVTVADVSTFIDCANDATKCSTPPNVADAETLKTKITKVCEVNPSFCGLTFPTFHRCSGVVHLPKLAFFEGKPEGSELCKDDSITPVFFEVSMTQDKANPFLFTVYALAQDGVDILGSPK